MISKRNINALCIALATIIPLTAVISISLVYRIRNYHGEIALRDGAIDLGQKYTYMVPPSPGLHIEWGRADIEWWFTFSGRCVVIPLWPLWAAILCKGAFALADRSSPRQTRGKCIACTYNLRGTPARPDGSTICPECGTINEG